MSTSGIYWRDSDDNHITLEYSADLTSSPLDWTEVLELKALSRNPEASPEIDFTHYGSTEQELKLGLARRGSFDGVCNFRPAGTGQAFAIIALNESKEELWWRVKYPKATLASTNRAQEQFRAYVQTAAISPPGAQDTNPVDFNFTLRVAGAYSFTAES